MKREDLELMKEELTKMEKWLEKAEKEKEIMTINYLVNIQRKKIERAENN